MGGLEGTVGLAVEAGFAVDAGLLHPVTPERKSSKNTFTMFFMIPRF